MIDANSTQVVEYMYDHLAKVNRSHETKNEKLHPFPVLLKNKLDFKLQLSKEQLYYADGLVYNRNEAGNYTWSYYLFMNKCSNWFQTFLAQGGSIIQRRLDEEWDVRARWAGVKAAYKKVGMEWLYTLKYDILKFPQL